MRFLIVDESREFRSALAGMLRARWPEAQIDEWDPRQRGNPAGSLAREHYDLEGLWNDAARIPIDVPADARLPEPYESSALQ